MRNTAKALCACIVALALTGVRLNSAPQTRPHAFLQDTSKSPRLDNGSDASATGLQLSLQSEKQTVGANQPVYVDVVIKNVTSEVIYVSNQSFVLPKIQLTVKDNQGVPVPLTRYGHLVYITISTSFFEHNNSYSIRPGTENRSRVLLSREFDMSLNEDYSVTAHTEFPTLDTKKAVEVISQPLTLSVVGPKQ